MKCRISRNHLRSVAFLFITVLTLLVAGALLAQERGGGLPSGNSYAVSVALEASVRAQVLERRALPIGNAERAPVNNPLKEIRTAATDSQNPLFMPAVLYDAGGGAGSVAVADVNGDGKPDLVVANLSGGVDVLLGNGDGTFQPSVTYYNNGSVQGWSIAVGDLNGDLKPDIAAVGQGIWENAAVVLLGNGDGTFQEPLGYGLGARAFNPYQAVIADVNGDGKPDMVVAEDAQGNDSLVCVLLGNGDGTFQAAVTYDTGGKDAHSVAVADINRDGKPDLIVANASSSAAVLLGNGDGTFLPAASYGTGGEPFWVAVADVNGDGKPDVLVANLSGSVGVLRGNGDGTFRAPVTYSSGGSTPWGIAVADVNGDGKPDALVANLNSGSVGVLRGNGDGTFQAPLAYESGDASSSVVTADVNGDGKPDLLVSNYSFCNCWNEGGVALLLSGTGPRTPTTAALTSSANPLAPGQIVTYTTIVKTETGGAATGSVTLIDGNKTVAIVGLLGNQAAWSTSYTQNGSHTITVEYPGDANTTGSTSAPWIEHIMTLPVASKTQLATSGSPSFVGQPVTFTAIVTSKYGAIPDGEVVTFYDGSAIGSVPLVGGAAVYSTSSLSVKAHTIKATYSGDATFKPSTGTLQQVVDKYPTTTALSSSPNPSVYRETVTFTATVTPAGLYPPTGRVVFKDGTLGIGSATLSGGVAQFTKSSLAVGTHPITAQYFGDAASAKSTSSVLDQVVQ